MTGHTVDQTRQLIEWLDRTDIALLELSGPGQSVRLRRHGAGFESATSAPEPAAAAEAPPETTTVVRAHSVGLVLHAHPLREDALVRVGQQVSAGQTVALLKIGAVLLPVPAPRAGVVARIVAASHGVVGFGDPLVELE
jgi:acetyl-CoA carboxylase biotin carboxyl carrier protein